MLGRTLPSGSDAISFHNTLFRVSELCWVKAVRLSPPELAVRVVSLLLAIAWVFAMKSAKGTVYNVEFLLGLFPLVLAWSTSSSLKIGCTGDFEEAYEERRGARSDLFYGWIETLQAKEPGWFRLKGASYDILLNPQRLAWIRPCFQWKTYPLVVVAAFVGYLYLLGLNLPYKDMPVIDDFQILIFEGSSGTVRLLSYLIIAVAVAAFALSFKRSVEICGAGGVQDVFPTTLEEQKRLMNTVAGLTSPQPQSIARPNHKSEPKTIEAVVAKPKEATTAPPAPQEDSSSSSEAQG